jgi:tetratricopeptide (TPR) repeat protein
LLEYLQLYRNSKHQYRLLQRRGSTGKNHPEPVATTWSLSFTQVEQLNPLAADLLRCCAFLAPDAIPEQLLLDGASELGPHFQPLLDDASLINEAIGTLLRFSLVKRKREEAALALHRLVQAILRTSMNEQTQQVWIERTVRAVNRAFPDVKDYRNWSRGQQYLPHALACTMWIRDGNPALPEAANLFNTLGYYLKQHAQYAEAEPLYQRAIAIGEKVLGPEHPDLATWLSNLANLYQAQGKYAEAEPLYQQAIAIGEKVLGPEHPNLATWCINLATLYTDQSKYAEAEPLFERAIAIREQKFGNEHPLTAAARASYTAMLKKRKSQEPGS